MPSPLQFVGMWAGTFVSLAALQYGIISYIEDNALDMVHSIPFDRTRESGFALTRVGLHQAKAKDEREKIAILKYQGELKRQSSTSSADFARFFAAALDIDYASCQIASSIAARHQFFSRFVPYTGTLRLCVSSPSLSYLISLETLWN